MTLRGGSSRAFVGAIFACLHSALLGVIVSTPYVWTGAGTDANWTNSANWQNGLVPSSNGTSAITFGAANQTKVLVNSPQNVYSLAFNFTAASGYASYHLVGGTGATLTLGSGGLTANAATSTTATTNGTTSAPSSSSYGYYAAEFDSSVGLILGADQAWSSSGAFVYVNGTVSGSGKLTLNSGYFTLAGNNTYSGGTILNGADLMLGSNTALGTGALTVNSVSYLSTSGGARSLGNALNLNADLYVAAYDGSLTFSGPTTLGADVRLHAFDNTLFLDGAIGETGGARKLTISSFSTIVLSGANTYTGGTTVDYGALVFRNANSVPTTGALTATSSGYVGIGFNTGVQSGFINKFDRTTMQGTIGFDTDPSATSATVFSEPIDLSNPTTDVTKTFSDYVRLGSVTRATLGSTATITPQSATAGYRFGGGGGTLTVASALTGAYGVTADSPIGDELTVNLTNTSNTYTGPTSATNSAIVFGAGAISASSGSFMTGTGGYIGTFDSAVTPSTFIGKFSSAMTTGVIGFDSSSVTNPRSIASPNLSGFTAGKSIALGTSSAATLTGTITLPPTQTGYYFAGYKGGVLLVNSDLTGTASVVVGGMSDTASSYGYSYPVFDPNDATKISSVSLNGNNTYSGGTSLYGGRLVLGSANALGTGALTIEQNSADAVQLHNSLTTSPTFANALVLRNDLEIGGLNSFTLSGSISDGGSGYSGLISKFGNFTLTIAGNNSGFSGGWGINEGTLAFTGNTSAGTGTLYFGEYGNTTSTATPTATFSSATPSIGGLEGYASGARVNLGSGTTLTINQQWDSVYAGQFVGSGGIEKAGTASLRLEGSSASFTGPTKISSGVLDVATSGALGNNTVTLNGTGKLFVEPGVTLANPIAFGANGGTVAGSGTFGSAVSIGASSAVSPGNSVGTLTFAYSSPTLPALTFGTGGGYYFQVQDATGTAGTGWDTINVTGSLAFTATPTAPFTIYLSSLMSGGANGNAANFVASNSYSWQIVSTTSGISGFNSSAVLVNTSGFTNPLGIGSFNVTAVGNNLFLNFTPVPEPSTWALLVGGLGVLGVGAWRRRNARR
jgi:autotransporter-associated beta strand protein